MGLGAERSGWRWKKLQEAIPKPHLRRQCRSGEMHVNLGDRIMLASFAWEFRGRERGKAHRMEKPVSTQFDRGNARGFATPNPSLYVQQ